MRTPTELPGRNRTEGSHFNADLTLIATMRFDRGVVPARSLLRLSGTLLLPSRMPYGSRRHTTLRTWRPVRGMITLLWWPRRRP
jgi:hypothetical protein